MRHLASFLRSPLGYLINLLCTILVHAERGPYPVMRLAIIVGGSGWMANACETFCARDGVQDDMLF